MPGYNPKGVSPAVLQEMYTPQMETALSGYISAQLRPRIVDEEVGIIRTFESQYGLGIRHPSRKVEVARGESTPKGNAERIERKYRVRPRAKAIGIDYLSKYEGERYSSELSRLMQDIVGMDVRVGLELELESVLLGEGTADDGQDVDIRILTNAQRFDEYGTAGVGFSDVAGIIKDAIKATGGRSVTMGEDVWDALARHPQFTNRFAGTGSEILGDDQVANVLRGFGLRGSIYIGTHMYSTLPREQGIARANFFDGVFAIYRDEALTRVELGPYGKLSFDSYTDDDSRMTYLRAMEDAGIYVELPAHVRVHQNVLTPA